MPYHVVHQHGQYCVSNTETDKVVPGGCHNDQGDALDHMKALYAHVPDASLSSEPPVTYAPGELEPDEVIPENPVVSEAMDPIAAPAITEHPWAGPVAYEGQSTGDRRSFLPGSIKWDPEALAAGMIHLSYQRENQPGHEGAVVIGRVDHLERLDDGSIHGRGVVLQGENIPPEAGEFLALMDGGAAGGVSLDLDSPTAEAVELADGTKSVVFSDGRIRGLTAVSIPAFADAFVSLADGGVLASVVGNTGLPMVGREQHFDGLAAQKRIFEWAKSGDALDVSKLKQVFLWQDSSADPQNRTAYKLPFADIIDGSPKAFPKAIFAAAQAVEGARGGLAVPDADKAGIRAKLTTLYGKINGSKGPDDAPATPPWNNDAGNGRSTDLAVEPVVLAEEPVEVELIAQTTEELAAVITLAKAKKKAKAKKPAFPGAAQPYAAEVVVASAIPVKPPAEWFENPKLSELTPITVTPDGRVFGHLAGRDTCHIGMQDCISPGRQLMGRSEYAYFHVGELETSEGETVAVGHLTFATGHAELNDSARAAAAHYDNTGTVAADVRAGEDEFGIWLAGGLRSTLSDEQIREFRSAPPSGDWRRIGGKLELVAALAVNTPGFPVPRTKVLVASGHEHALVLTEDYPTAIAAAGDDHAAIRLRLKQRIVNSVKQEGI